MAKKSSPKSRQPSSAPRRNVEPSLRRWRALGESRTFRIAAFAVVVLLFLVARFVKLGADPAMDVSWSHALFTDPPQYTSYARNAIVFGEWNPLHDDRLIFFQKNVTGFVAYIVFLITGPGVASGQFVALLFNLLAVGFLAWAMGRAFGYPACLFTALFLSLNYLFVQFGRMPFLEVAANACLAISLWAVVVSKDRWWWAVVGGAVAGIGAFFGKVTALHAVPVFLVAAALVGYQASSEAKMHRWGRPVGYVAGLGFVYAFWFVFAYMSASDQVLAYLKEQSLSLYGTPIGLTSISGFFSQWFTFSMNNSLLTWSPVLGILGMVGMLALTIRNVAGKSFGDFLKRVDPFAVAVVGWFWVGWAAFMPFNYRPVRYQIVLLLPLAAAAGWLVSRAFVASEANEQVKNTPRASWIGVLPAAIFGATALQVMAMPQVLNMSSPSQFKQALTLSVIGGLVIAGIWVAWQRRTKAAPTRGMGRLVLNWAAVAFVAIFLINQTRHFTNWWSQAQYSIADANRDLKFILAPGAILTGGYGTPLTQANGDDRLGNFPAMFGVSTVDHEFFQKFPVTHVAEVDDKNQPFFKNYPQISEQSDRVTTYTIRDLPVSVVRVAESGGNPQAEAYQPSSYERMRHASQDRPLDSVLAYLPQWIADSGDCFSGWRWLGDLYTRANRLDEALNSYEKAAGYFPDDFYLWAQIGDVSWEIFRGGATSNYRDIARDAWIRAEMLSPGNPQLMNRLARVNGP